MKDIFESRRFIYIVLELVTHGELFDFINCGDIPQSEVALVAYQLLKTI